MNSSVSTAQEVSAEQQILNVIELSRSMQTHVVRAIEQMSDINRATHLLSMNARIEAARAGKAGLGFAVVAQELTRLSGEMKSTADAIVARSLSIGREMDDVIGHLSTRVRENRLCDLALNVVDVIDRNLYERSCDVRWWATDSAVTQCLEAPSPESISHARRRLGQILDSYTVYFDLVVADLAGTVVANGRPQRFRSAGTNVANTEWFHAALATRDSTRFGFQSAHASPLANQQRALVYSCVVRRNGDVRGQPLGVLGIVFNWPALGDVIVGRVPLSPAEMQTTRVCVTDDSGLVLADTAGKALLEKLEFPGRDSLFRSARGAITTHMGARKVLVAHAASPGFETYRTGWHGVVLRQLE